MPTKNIEDACKAIRSNWEVITNEFIKSSPGRYLILTCVYRAPEEQVELFKKGRVLGTSGEWKVVDPKLVVTNVDGIKVLGAHNYKPARAIDVAVVDNQTGKIIWDETAYSSLIEIARSVGLVSGGSWKTFKDWPHIEVPNYKTYKES